MAKQVEDIVVRLVGEGFEALDKIKGSFRELGKVTNLAEKDILSARDSLLDYARRAGNTEAVNKGLGDAFKGLRSQVDMCSDAYRVLSADLRQIDEVSRGATQSIMAQRSAVLASTTAGTQNVAALQQQRAALIALRAQTRDASTAFNQFNADIEKVETSLTDLANVNNRLNSALSRARAGTAAGARAELAVIEDGIALRRQEINDIDLLNKKQRNTPKILRQRLEIENQLNASLAARRQIQFQETARTGREGARTGAATFNGADLTGTGYLTAERISGRLGDLPNTTAGLSQELGELNERLINTYRNTETYIAVQLRLAEVQRQVSAATQGYGAALRAQLDAGTLIPSQKNLAEVIGQLRREMLELDTTTTEGGQAYANNARQADQLQRQLRELAGAYRQVGTTATVAAAAEQNAANARIRNNYLGRGAVRQQEQALRELGNRVQQGVAATPLLLPAAGQTSAPGTGQTISGANVTPGTRASRTLRDSKTVRMIGYGSEQPSGVELFFSSTEPGRFASSRPIGPTATPSQAAQNRSEQIAQRDGLKATADAARATEQQMQRLRAAVDTATKANTGSVSSLGRLREALVNLRNEIPGTEKEFRDLNQQVGGVDRRASRLQTSRRPSTGQLVQAGGAAISGGIFGGPEGFLGGVGGAVLGTVLPGIGTAGGAFAGAAAGAQVGMFRQQLAGTADYAASIGKLQIALRGVVGSQAAYDAAIRAAAAATRDLNIPQEEATRGLTRLSAAVIGAGGTVADSSFAFRAMSEAIKATGGNAEQVDGALLALTQVFSKGKVSAEELNQIAERLPGTFTLFAQAAGKTGPELQKALEQGQVGLNDLMKFLDLTSKRYGTTALEIAGSSQDAGARLTVAFQAMRLEVGKALQPLGAELQGAFAKFIEDITPDVVSSAKAIAEVLKFFTTNEVAGGLAKFALELTAVGLAIKGLQAAAAGLTALNLASWFTGAATGIKITGDAAAVAAPKVGLLKATLSGFIGLVSKPIVVTIVIASVIEAIKRISAANSAFADFLKLAKQPIAPDAWLKSVGGDALSTDKLKQFAAEASKVLKFNTSEIDRLKKARATVTMQQLYAEDNVQQSILNTQLVTIDTQITNAEKRVKESQAKLDALNRQINAPRQAATTTGTNFPGPAGEDKDKAGEKAARDAAAAAAEQQRLNESLAKARIALDDEVFRNAMELVRKKYEYEQELEGKRRNLLVLSQTGAARGAAELVASYFENMQTLTNRLANAGDVVKTATQGLKSATALAETTVSTITAASGGGTIANILPGTRGGPNITEGVGYGRGRLHAGQDLGLDIGDPIHARRAGTVMQAYPSGFGRVGGAVVVRYDDGTQGTYGHTTPSVRAGSAVAAGQRIATVAPDGSNTHLHYELRDALGKLINPINALTASLKVPAGARQATGVAAATRRDVATEGGAATAAQGLAQAKALQTLEEKQVKDLTALGNQEFVLKYTDALRQQNAALTDAATVTELRNKLQLAGERPETIEAEVRKTEETMRARQETEFLTKAIETLTGKGPAAEESANAFRAALAAQNVELANTKTKLDEAAAAQIAFNEAMRTRQDDRIGLGMKEGALAYVESVGTMREATAQLTQNGIKGLEDQLFSLVTTGKANFQEFAAEILKQSARMILQLTIQRVIMQIIGAIGGGGAPASPSAPGGDWMDAVSRMNPTSDYAMGGAFAKNNIVPYAMGGTFTNSVVSKPTLFKFANGGTMRTGLMGEAGPEAIMPLSRGANGKLGVASIGGGGTTNVVVNVDASGNSQVAGDQNQGVQLGRVISQAVQAELVKQKRPGGLLAA